MGIFGGAPKPPPVPPPMPMPDLMDPAIRDAKRRALSGAQVRGGRASTILTGDEYSGSQLGVR